MPCLPSQWKEPHTCSTARLGALSSCRPMAHAMDASHSSMGSRSASRRDKPMYGQPPPPPLASPDPFPAGKPPPVLACTAPASLPNKLPPTAPRLMPSCSRLASERNAASWNKWVRYSAEGCGSGSGGSQPAARLGHSSCNAPGPRRPAAPTKRRGALAATTGSCACLQNCTIGL
eukprot:scaffold9795_cov146-Isochrysis_galbana.AAC.2